MTTSSKVRSFRLPYIIYDYFIVRGMKLGKIFKEAINIPMVVKPSVLTEYEAGRETTIRINDEDFKKIQERAMKEGLGHTTYMRLMMINYYTVESMEEY